MRLGHQLSTRSVGAFRVHIQKRGERLALAVGRRHKTIEAAGKELVKQCLALDAVYGEIRRGRKVISVWAPLPKSARKTSRPSMWPAIN